jgi:hypothetical protein
VQRTEEWKMKQTKSNGNRRRAWWRQRAAASLAILMVLLFSGTALAAEVLEGDPYILPRGEVLNDDLYVAGSEVIIDGTVEGDLVVAAGYVEVNGVVMGDLLAAGGAVVITGAIQDDVRAAGGGVILSGTVGDDFFAAGGGGWPGMASIPIMGTMQTQGREVPQGVQVAAGASIGGDAYVAGGQGLIAGSIGRNLNAGMGNLTFSGQTAGDANLNAQTLTVLEGASVQGELRYSTGGNTVIPEGVAASVVQQPWDGGGTEEAVTNPVGDFFRWLLRTGMAILGMVLAGWLIWTFAPRQITEPVAIMETRPMEAGIMGLLVAVVVVPLIGALTFLAGLFWGWFPGGVFMASFLFGLFALIALLSPIVTGLWVGRKLAEVTGLDVGELPRLLLGIVAIVLVGRLLTVIPCIGDLTFLVLYLVSFALTVGSWVLVRWRPSRPSSPVVAQPAPRVQVF